MNKSKYYTLMFMPEDNGKTFSLRIHKFILRSLIVFLVIFTSGLIMLLSKSGEIAAKLQVLHLVKAENEKLTVENRQLKQIEEKLEQIEIMSQYIERLAVIPERRNRLNDNSKKANFNLFGFNDSLKKARSNTGYSINSDRIASIPTITPVEGWITKKFSSDTSSSVFHQGIDFAAAYGTAIRATAMGVVQDIQDDKYYGLLVTIRHDNGFITKYGHCSQILVSKNVTVQRGQTIALVGNTGRSTAPHLHYEVIKDGRNVNPSEYLFVNSN